MNPGQKSVESRLSTTDILKYNQPNFVLGFFQFIVAVYLMKYTTDILGIAPVTIGVIMFMSRIWDAVTDPLIGFLSDRTTAAMGRRRPWILSSSLPLALSFIMLWSAPPGLGSTGQTIWTATAVILFFSAMTVLSIPLLSLGAELSDSYYDRTRLFGYRHGFFTCGSLLAVVAMYLLSMSDDERGLMLNISLVTGVLTVVLVVSMVAFIRERPEFQKKRETNPFRSFSNVVKNKYALLLILIYLLNFAGLTFSAVFTPYISEYILGAPETGALFLLLYLAASILSTPFWIRLSRSFGKKNLWHLSALMLGVTYGAAYFLGPGAIWYAAFVYVAFGLGASAGGVVGPSIQADVIDYGEYLTGKRTEGAYFATWLFTEKVAMGVAFLIAGIVLELAGIVPNVEQSAATKSWIMTGFSIIPMLFYLSFMLLIFAFKLDEREYRRIRDELDRRAVTGSSSATEQTEI